MMSRLARLLAAFAFLAGASVSPLLAAPLPAQPDRPAGGEGTTRHVLEDHLGPSRDRIQHERPSPRAVHALIPGEEEAAGVGASAPHQTTTDGDRDDEKEAGNKARQPTE